MNMLAAILLLALAAWPARAAVNWPQSSLKATSALIGGSALVAGSCTTGTVAIAGATTAMAAIVSPVTYPGNAIRWDGYVSAAGTVTIVVCADVAATPAASIYNVRVMP